MPPPPARLLSPSLSPRGPDRTRPRRARRALLAAVLALAAAGARAAGEPPPAEAELLREGLAAACAAQGPEAAARRLAGARVEDSRPLRAGDTALGWHARLALGSQRALVLEHLAPFGELRQAHAELHEAIAGELRPRLVALAGPGCDIRVARRLEYTGSGRASAIEYLHADLSASGSGALLDPPVPAAPDPGGVPVALVDAGVNYLLPEIGAGLARDADGALLGYDWWDLDRRPFDANPARSAFFPQRHGTRTASLLLEEAPVARLLPYRYPRPDMARMRALVEAAAAAGVTIVNLSMGSGEREDWTAFAEAARAHPGMLFVVSAGNDGRDLDAQPVYPAALGLENLLSVTSAGSDGRPAPGSNWGRRSVDLLVPAERMLVTDFDGSRTFASGSSYAAVRVSALAACLLAAHPQWRAPELRAAILAQAQQAPGGPWTAHGGLPDPAAQARGACAPVDDALHEVARETIAPEVAPPPAAPSPRLRLEPAAVALAGAGWSAAAVRPVLAQAATLLAQCGIAVPRVRLTLLLGPERLRYFTLETAQALARRAAAAPPALYLVGESRRPVRFDAETFAPANSADYPVLTDSVWLTRRMRDPGIALAHELVHLLADSGEHSPLPRNLMREQTAPQNTELTAEQCELIRTQGTARGLLQPPGK